jgi:nucleoside-diphosphate-sugar epimerase
LAKLIQEVIGFDGEIQFDPNKLNGTYQKLLDVSNINNLGWNARAGLQEGIESTYHWFLNNYEKIRN